MHAGVISGTCMGEQKMLDQLKERYYWPGMTEDVKHWCQTCATCPIKKTRSNSEWPSNDADRARCLCHSDDSRGHHRTIPGE